MRAEAAPPIPFLPFTVGFLSRYQKTTVLTLLDHRHFPERRCPLRTQSSKHAGELLCIA